MEYFIYTTLLLVLLPFILNLFCLSPTTTNKQGSQPRLPPGPRPWPIIGNILDLLGDNPHRSVAELCKSYGPVMNLRLGSVNTVVISSPEAAREMFGKNDLACSSRQVPDAARVFGYDEHSLVWHCVCPKWRALRKVVTVELFAGQRLDASQGLRREKVGELVDHARGQGERGLAVDVGRAAFTAALNLLSSTIFSVDLSGSLEFRDIFSEVMEDGARPNVSDFFPALRGLDLQGIRRRIKRANRKIMGVFERIIDERLGGASTSGRKDDVLGTLLKLVEEDQLCLEDVKAVILDLFIAGTDTTTSTIEWAMTELLRNPQKMEKAQTEIDRVIGKEGVIQESDISRLPYIQAIVKETLRIHPPAPFLVPHKAISDVQICGYFVPKDSQIWVHVWMMGRDPGIWANPGSFQPERFLDRDVDVKGRDFELIPFGAGRRMCPGIPLADRMVHLVLATLLHSFDWKLGDGAKPQDVDVEEKFGITLQKVRPLLAIPISRS